MSHRGRPQRSLYSLRRCRWSSLRVISWRGDERMGGRCMSVCSLVGGMLPFGSG